MTRVRPAANSAPTIKFDLVELPSDNATTFLHREPQRRGFDIRLHKDTVQSSSTLI